MMEEKVLTTEILPTQDRYVLQERVALQGSRSFEPVMHRVVEKTPIVQEVEKWRIIEEVTPVVYKEVVVPTVIKTTKPIREVVIEAPVYSTRVMERRSISESERSAWSQYLASASSETFVRSAPPQPINLGIRIPVMETTETVTTTTTSTTTDLPAKLPANQYNYNDTFNTTRAV
eukprot:TRINITY_DN23135_c1_g1_i1.p2 TRINITY_DN23135_c1_g1~~TRINITY_DN23135_c1_g1_i1.p2  ORF type:complete len:175 (+),score=58.11 TRINITY_DN23135_c1_g1_i1:3-527(+)